MATIRIQPFSGIVPRLSANLLTNGQAQTSLNAKLYSGEIRPWRQPSEVTTTLAANTSTIYRLTDGSTEKWLSWDADVDIAPSQVSDTTDRRIYYTTAGSTPKKTNIALATTGAGPWPAAYRALGVTAPSSAPTLVKVDGSGTSETRAYVYTNISTFGSVLEESAPSDATTVSVLPTGCTVTVSGFSNPVITNQNITHRRIYRSLTDSYLLVAEEAVYEATVTITNASPAVVSWTGHGFSVGQPVFFRTTGALPTGITANTAYFVIAAGLGANSFQISLTSGGAAINTSSAGSGVHTGSKAYSDTLAAASIPGDALPSLDWAEPPSDLEGLVNMPNGMMAGFVGNDVYFCEPYYPHAWPTAYSLSVENQIVGLGVFGSSLVVCTEGRPYVMSGIHPSSMTQEKLPLLEPCVSKRSIAQDQYGVLYASPNGLVGIGPGTMDVVSKALYSRDDWQELNPSSMNAEIYSGSYIATYGEEGKAIVLSRSDTPALTELQWDASALYVDQITAKLYGVSNVDDLLYQFDADPYNNLSYEWRSPRYVVNAPTAFTCYQLDADYDGAADTAAIIAANATLAAANASYITSGTLGEMNAACLNKYTVNGSALATLSSVESRSVTVTFYADDVLVHSVPVGSLGPLRLPPVRAYTWEIVISGTVAARSFFMATSVAELRMG
jgi:hypothetical protein